MDEQVYTTYQISKICSVDITTIMAWVDDGKLRAYRTPGGHRRVLHSDLIAFLKKYNMPIPRDVREGGQKILIVDDDAMTVRLISRFLSKVDKNFQIETALDGFEAGQKLETFQPDIVILDILLPGVDGFRVLKNIRAHKTSEHIKICIISGIDIESTKAKALRAGADAFLAKPFDPERLSEILKSFLNEQVSV